MAVRPYLVNGEWRTGEGTFEVHSPFDDSVVAEIGVPTQADVEEAVATAASTFEESRKLPVWARSEALDHVSKRLGETIEENAKLIAAEGGGIVVEGRDITTVVAPDADARVLLTASEQARLARRALEVHGRDDDEAIAATRDHVVRRDAQDATVAEFLEAGLGVTVIDSSELSFEETVDAVLAVVGRVGADR